MLFIYPILNAVCVRNFHDKEIYDWVSHSLCWVSFFVNVTLAGVVVVGGVNISCIHSINGLKCFIFCHLHEIVMKSHLSMAAIRLLPLLPLFNCKIVKQRHKGDGDSSDGFCTCSAMKMLWNISSAVIETIFVLCQGLRYCSYAVKFNGQIIPIYNTTNFISHAIYLASKGQTSSIGWESLFVLLCCALMWQPASPCYPIFSPSRGVWRVRMGMSHVPHENQLITAAVHGSHWWQLWPCALVLVHSGPPVKVIGHWHRLVPAVLVLDLATARLGTDINNFWPDWWPVSQPRQWPALLFFKSTNTLQSSHFLLREDRNFVTSYIPSYGFDKHKGK